MVRVAAGLVGEGRDGITVELGAVPAGAEGVHEPGGEDHIELRFASCDLRPASREL